MRLASFVTSLRSSLNYLDSTLQFKALPFKLTFKERLFSPILYILCVKNACKFNSTFGRCTFSVLKMPVSLTSLQKILCGMRKKCYNAHLIGIWNPW